MKRHEKLTDVITYIAFLSELRDLSEKLVTNPEVAEVTKQEMVNKAKELADWLKEEVDD